MVIFISSNAFAYFHLSWTSLSTSYNLDWLFPRPVAKLTSRELPCRYPENFLYLPSVLDLVFLGSHIFPFLCLLHHFNRENLLMVFQERMHGK